MNSELRRRITAAGQEHLLDDYDRLGQAERMEFEKQLENIDFKLLHELIATYVLNRPEVRLPEPLEPAPYFPLCPGDAAQAAYYERARGIGGEALAAGRVAALTVAGGQGTRLGFDGPKGTYPITPVTGKSLFQYFAESLLRAGEKYGHPVDWYIMTSDINDRPTRDFFAAHDNFGIAAENICFFTQGTMPAIGYDGRLLLVAPGKLALSPDGHGGTLLALAKSGALARMKARGTDFISYFQVDNPLVRVVDALFIGLHVLENAEMSAIMLAKVAPLEKVGNFCVSDGRLYVIEYSDLPERLACDTKPDGSLRFIAGSPAMHVLSRDFVARLTAGGRLELPWHRADKKIKCLDAEGVPCDPDRPNGVKLESFIFDALPLARKTMVLEAERREVFAPTKNATGVDSAESCRVMLMERDARRLEKAGCKVPRLADGALALRLELSPRTLWDEADVADYVRSRRLTVAGAPGTAVALG